MTLGERSGPPNGECFKGKEGRSAEDWVEVLNYDELMPEQLVKSKGRVCTGKTAFIFPRRLEMLMSMLPPAR